MHLGLRLARAFGHPEVEVEHVAHALLTTCPTDLSATAQQVMIQQLETYFTGKRKIYGIGKLLFGRRLLGALEEAAKTKIQALQK